MTPVIPTWVGSVFKKPLRPTISQNIVPISTMATPYFVIPVYQVYLFAVIALERPVHTNMRCRLREITLSSVCIHERSGVGENVNEIEREKERERERERKKQRAVE